jgi:alpha/beta superfamily hydrolase
VYGSEIPPKMDFTKI